MEARLVAKLVNSGDLKSDGLTLSSVGALYYRRSNVYRVFIILC